MISKKQVIQPIDKIDEGYDSSIHAGKSYFYKSYYSHVTKKILEDYCLLHKYLSQFEREFDLPIAQEYYGKKIKKIIFDVVPLDKKHVYEAYSTDDKEKHVVSYPPQIV